MPNPYHAQIKRATRLPTLAPFGRVAAWVREARNEMREHNLEITGSENYSAVVVKVEELHDLDGLDRLKGLAVFGLQALVSADVPTGELMIVFPAGAKLSPEFAAANNLYRHKELNVDKGQAGYFEDTGRVKAMKMRGNRSDAFATPVSSLEPLLGCVPDLVPGATFDTIDGVKICEKYVLPQRRGGGVNKSGTVSKKLVPDHAFPEHYDTAQFKRNRDRYSPSDHVVVTQKLHGTSVRLGNVRVERKLSLVERIARFFGAKVEETEFAFVVGSRRVTKSVNGQSKPGSHYYADDMWTSSVAHLRGKIPPGFVVYGELIGWTPTGGAIQGGYTYGCKAKECDLYVYRVTSINDDGDQFDLCWYDLETFCDNIGLRIVPALFAGTFADFEAREHEFIDRRFFPEYRHAVPLSNPKSVDEGVCIRSQNGIVTKHKSPIFLGHESAMMDKGTIDIEEEQATDGDDGQG